MKTYIIKPALLLSVMFFFNSNIFPQGSVNLQYNLPQGKTYLYKTDMDNSITQEMMGQEIKILNNIHSITRVVIDSITENGNMNVLVSADSAIVHNVMQGKDTTMSLNSLIGKRSKIVVSKFGEIISKGMLDSLDSNAGMMGASILQGASNLYMKLPGKEIKEGDSWTSTKVDTVESMGGKIIINSDYTFTLGNKEDKNGISCYKIPYASTIASKGKATMQGFEFFIEGNGKMTGNLYLSADNGALVSNESKNENEMTLATTGQQNMVIPITQSSTSTTELISK